MKYYLSFLFCICIACSSFKPNETPTFDFNKLKQKAKEAKLYCQKKKANTDFCILIDLSRHSGLERFYIWDFKKDTIQYSCLVSHGCCDNPWGDDDSKETAGTSNVDGSHCSSLGKFFIDKRGYSSWGIHVNYLLHGLDATNSNALKRQIVLHSWDMIAEERVYPEGTPEGWGCPAVANKSMKVIDAKLKDSNGKVLMWIFK